MIDPYIYNIAEICARCNVKHVVISPGSRCAPLIIAFNRHPEIEVKSVPDERSAAYIALGMSIALDHKPVALVCTSGTATTNYFPALAEAYYQKIPLIAITADRPPEWIGQQDNQAINQDNLYGNLVKSYFQVPVDLGHKDAKWHMVRGISENIQYAKEPPYGPVHINVPIREPFYPEDDVEITYDELRIPEYLKPQIKEFELPLDDLEEVITNGAKVILLVGQVNHNEQLIQHLNILSASGVVVIGDVTSNIAKVDKLISHHDLFIHKIEDHPDIIISLGDAVLSKNLKKYIRKYPPLHHFHLQESGNVADTFQTITRVIRCEPVLAVAYLSKKLVGNEVFAEKWINTDSSVKNKIDDFYSENKKGELAAVKILLKSLEEPTYLHLANSMAVRYVNILGVDGKHKVFSNRGTSGIDGCNSTAVGNALINSSNPHLLISGDMAFLYDRNAFWHNHSIDNLKIFIINNHGGGIFRLISGPDKLEELDLLMETEQKSKASYVAKEFGFEYFQSKDIDQSLVFAFLKYEGKAIYEVTVNSKENKQLYELFKKALN